MSNPSQSRLCSRRCWRVPSPPYRRSGNPYQDVAVGAVPVLMTPVGVKASTMVCPESAPDAHVPPVPMSRQSPCVVAQLTLSVVCPVDVPGEEIPIVIDVLLFDEFVFWTTIGADRFTVEVPESCVPPMTAGSLNDATPVAADQSKMPAVVVANVCVEYVMSAAPVKAALPPAAHGHLA